MILLKKKLMIIISILALILMFGRESVFATLVTKMSLTEMVKQSDLIIEGTVSKIQSQWNEEKTMIYTDIEINIKSAEKGSSQNNLLVIRLLGGRVGNIATIALGTPAFHRDEQLVLFLKELKPETLTFFLGKQTTSKLSMAYGITGWNQGYFKIMEDSQVEKKILRQVYGENKNLNIKDLRNIIKQTDIK